MRDRIELLYCIVSARRNLSAPKMPVGVFSCSHLFAELAELRFHVLLLVCCFGSTGSWNGFDRPQDRFRMRTGDLVLTALRCPMHSCVELYHPSRCFVLLLNHLYSAVVDNALLQRLLQQHRPNTASQNAGSTEQGRSDSRLFVSFAICQAERGRGSDRVWGNRQAKYHRRPTILVRLLQLASWPTEGSSREVDGCRRSR